MIFTCSAVPGHPCGGHHHIGSIAVDRRSVPLIRVTVELEFDVKGEFEAKGVESRVKCHVLLYDIAELELQFEAKGEFELGIRVRSIIIVPR